MWCIHFTTFLKKNVKKDIQKIKIREKMWKEENVGYKKWYRIKINGVYILIISNDTKFMIFDFIPLFDI